MASDLVSLWYSQWVTLQYCMGASVLVAPRDGKVVEEMQLAAGMYADREGS